MLVTHELNIDLTKHSRQPEVAAVQGEANTRQLAISLFSNSIAWEIPSGATAAVAFLKPDGTKGLYDRLPDGTVATTLSGNTVNAVLAPQALTCAGIVLASVIFYDADGDTLATFPFRILVAQNPAAGEQISNDYYSPSIHDLDQAIKALEEQVEALDPGGIKDVIRHSPQELTEEQQEQARKNIGAASKDDLDALEFMPSEGDPEAEVRFDVVHAEQTAAPEFLIVDPETPTESIILTKEGAEEGETPRKAAMLSDAFGEPVILSNVANPEVGTDAANMSWVNKKVNNQIEYAIEVMEDKRIKVSGAEVGQVLKVSAVDENGVPTAWETADGEKQWELLVDFTAQEDCASVSFTEDMYGEPFDLSEAFCVIKHVNTSDDLTKGLNAVMFPLKEYGLSFGGSTSPSTACHHNGIIKGGSCPKKGYTMTNGFYVKSISDRILCGFAWTGQNTSSSASATKPCSISEKYLNNYIGAGMLRELHVSSLNENVGAGTKIKLWGVRK